MKRGCPKSAARWTPKLKKLKAISIRQPWAWLIVNGYKDIENRIWAAKLRGPVLIHAGQSKSNTTPEALAYIKRKYRVPNLPDTFETGGIVGIAEITDCVECHRFKWFQGTLGLGHFMDQNRVAGAGQHETQHRAGFRAGGHGAGAAVGNASFAAQDVIKKAKPL
jgi:hypothetical protein